MKKIKIGLTGFGRIGRCISRLILSQPDIFELVIVNDINDDLNSLTYMLKYDSMHGILENDVKVGDGGFYFDNHFIKTYSRNHFGFRRRNHFCHEIHLATTQNYH